MNYYGGMDTQKQSSTNTAVQIRAASVATLRNLGLYTDRPMIPSANIHPMLVSP